MLQNMSWRSLMMGLLASFAGFAGSFAVVLQGLIAVGASATQAASGLMALSIAMGACAIVLSLNTRMPISVAWSTPGAAFLVSAGVPDGGFAAAIGAFLVCGCLIVIAGLWRPLERAVASIPSPIANAMLAGVLLGICLVPFKAVAFNPLLGLPIILAWIVAGAFNKLLAVPAALAAFAAVVVFGIDIPDGALAEAGKAIVPNAELVTPVFTFASIAGIAVPLFLVTMASQNIAGIAVLKANDYTPRPGPLFAVTGVFSLLSAPFGGHAVNLAAITAAMCAGPEAHEDPTKRYWAAVAAGIAFVILGLSSGAVTAFVNLAPTILIEAVAGLALIGAFVSSAVAALGAKDHREAAAITFLVTASGIGFFGISGAFWGLAAGGATVLITRLLVIVRRSS